MFRFNFNQNYEESENKTNETTVEEPKIVIKQSKCIETTQNQYEEIAQSLLDRSFQMFTSNSVEIGFVNNENINEKNNSDLISGVYEGGYKIWECTQDLADYFTDDLSRDEFTDKIVCDLGCSAGILGLLALINNAKCVHFQDYVSSLFRKIFPLTARKIQISKNLKFLLISRTKKFLRVLQFQM